MKYLVFISIVIQIMTALRVSKIHLNDTTVYNETGHDLESSFPAILKEQNLLKEDLEKCKQSAEGLEHTTWTEVCETEVSRVKSVHKEVMNKTSLWMLTLVDYGITNNAMNVSANKVNLE